MSDVVIDLGCYPHRGKNSIEALVDKYDPALLLGFDPYQKQETRIRTLDHTLVVESRMAAWVYNGRVTFHEDGWQSRVEEEGSFVPCFDLESLLKSLTGLDVILKMDVEGSEYVLLQHLGTWPSLLLIEWHPDLDRHDVIQTFKIPCPVEEWWM